MEAGWRGVLVVDEEDAEGRGEQAQEEESIPLLPLKDLPMV